MIVISGGAGTEAATDGADAADPEPGGAAADPDADAVAAVAEKPADIVVDVGGAVGNPAVLVLPAGSRVYEALESAGGLLPQADMSEINRAAALKDGDRIYIPSKEETASKTPVPQSAGGGAGPGVTNAAETSGDVAAAGTSGAAGAQININTADLQELQKLSGVGPSTAQKILDYRETHGRFGRIEDIKNVSGIGDKTFEKLKEHITVG
jgi:competence protein ComEA